MDMCSRKCSSTQGTLEKSPEFGIFVFPILSRVNKQTDKKLVNLSET